MQIISEMETHQLDLTDMELHIHRIEAEAYGAVLRAFIAQSNVLSWGKEALISELRKELRVSDVEHREILAKVNADNSVKTLRKLQKDADLLGEEVCTPRKRCKIVHTRLSSSPRTTEHFRDDQWDKGRAVVTSQANIRQGINSIPYSRQTPTAGNGRGSMALPSSRKGSVYSGGNALNSGPHTIEIRATEKLIHEVESLCGRENPDPRQVERAKFILREHERALMEAIATLANVPDDGNLATSIS